MTDHETLQPRGAGLLPVLPPFAVPSCGAGACSSQSPSFAPCAAVRVAHSAGVRCTRYSPLSVTAPGCLVLYPGWSVALSAAGLVFGRGWLPGLLVRVGAGCWSGLVAGLVAAPRGELVLNIPLVQLGLQASPNCTPTRGTNGIFSTNSLFSWVCPVSRWGFAFCAWYRVRGLVLPLRVFGARFSALSVGRYCHHRATHPRRQYRPPSFAGLLCAPTPRAFSSFVVLGRFLSHPVALRRFASLRFAS